MTIPTILSGAAGRALRAFEPIATANVSDMPNFAGWAARQTINSAKPDLVKALGAARQPAFSAEMHAAVANHRNGVRVPENAAQISTAMQELRSAANTTTATRLLGGLAVLGGIAGLVALSRTGGDSDSVPMAPGRPGDEPTYVST